MLILLFDRNFEINSIQMIHQSNQFAIPHPLILQFGGVALRIFVSYIHLIINT